MPKRFLALILIMIPAGCFQLDRYNVADPDPAVKIPSAKRDAAEHNLAHAATLVQDLSSDDAAVRFYAIQTLARLTGQDLGYDYTADDTARRPATQRWQAWLDRQSTQPARQISTHD